MESAGGDRDFLAGGGNIHPARLHLLGHGMGAGCRDHEGHVPVRLRGLCYPVDSELPSIDRFLPEIVFPDPDCRRGRSGFSVVVARVSVGIYCTSIFNTRRAKVAILSGFCSSRHGAVFALTDRK